MTVSSGGRQIVVDPLQDGLPRQRWDEILLHHERFYRASDAHRQWADKAKMCVEYYEGKQWAAADLKKLEDEGRPALVINKTRPLVNLALGYHLNNQTDRTARPSNDGTGTAEVARVLSHVLKNDSERNELRYVDCEVYLDGLTCGRGWWDIRQDFTKNLLGSTRIVAEDPFSLYVDPDATAYDPNDPHKGANFLIKSDWISVDETAVFYGQRAAERVRPLAYNGVSSSLPNSPYGLTPEVSPARTFAQVEDWPDNWRVFLDQSANWVDTYRRTVRRLDMQHWVRDWAWFVIDLETGDQKRIPDEWDDDRVKKLAMWAAQMNEPIMLQRRQARRMRWTHIVGDTVVFDRWSPLDRYSYVPYYPYFRRGVTQGMIDPLLDPQREINVRRSARLNIIGRSSNGGWKIEKGSMTPQNRRELEVNGGRPGFILEYDRKAGTLNPPEAIQPGQSPVSVEQLEKESDNDILEIAGINRSALGQVDQATVSGRAILARQQQTVVGMEGFLSNWHRSVRMSGRNMVDQAQAWYTEERLIRVEGQNNSDPTEMLINVRTADGVLNDITAGDYDVDIGETSLTDSFLAGQFNELMQMREAGLPVPDSFIVDASSVPRKEELRMAMAAQRQQEAALAQTGMGAQPQVQGKPAPGGPPQRAARPQPGAPGTPNQGSPPLPAGGPMGPQPPPR